MHVITLSSACGGNGRTSLLAQLANGFARMGRTVLALDLDPQNRLALHLGLSPDYADGFATRWLGRDDWREAGLISTEQIRLMPFGHPSLAGMQQFAQHLQQEPDWLAQQLATLALPSDAIVLIDTPVLPSPMAQAAVRAANLVLAVTRPDAAAPLAIQQLDDLLQQARPGLVVPILINAISPNRELDRAVADVLRANYPERLAPYSVHFDSALPEALAADVNLYDYAPHSQATHDMHGLTGWLLARLDALAEITAEAT